MIQLKVLVFFLYLSDVDVQKETKNFFLSKQLKELQISSDC